MNAANQSELNMCVLEGMSHYEGPPPDPPPVVELPIRITEDNYETFNYAAYDWLIVVAIRRHLHEVTRDPRCRDRGCYPDLDMERFAELRDDSVTRPRTFSISLARVPVDIDGEYYQMSPFDDIPTTCPHRIREFLFRVVGFRTENERVIKGIFKLPGNRPHVWEPLLKFVDEVFAEFVIYVYLSEDKAIHYGFDRTS